MITPHQGLNFAASTIAKLSDCEEELYMSDPRPAVLGLFSTYRFATAFWQLDSPARAEAARSFLKSIESAADATSIYSVGGTHSGIDLLVWSTVRVESSASPGEFFVRRGAAEARFRSWLDPVNVLWGLTRPSEYSRARSAQEIDPFEDQRMTYIIAYPFTKTSDWYLLGREARQGMMNEHIAVGKQFREIKQLLLYSFGLQDHEFVVVYETEDLDRFSRLVHDLRATEGRRYTKADAPLQIGVLTDVERFVASLD